MDNDGKYTLSEVFLAEGDVAETEDGLVWKTLLREGTWRMSPDPSTQNPVDKPMIVRKKGPVGVADDHYDISLEDIVESFEQKAMDHVTVPTTHDNKVLDNTGYVRRLKVVEDDDGNAKLVGGLEFTEPDVKEKALRGSVPNTSCGLLYDYVRKQDGKVFPIALDHAALTPKPWINGMDPFGVSLAEGEEVVERLAFSEQVSDEAPEPVEPEAEVPEEEEPEVEEEETVEEPDEETVDDEPTVQLSELEEAQRLRTLRLAQAEAAAKPPTATDTPRGGDTVKKDKKDMTEAELKLAEKLDEQAAEAKAREDALKLELSELRKEKHESYVDAKIEELKGKGLDQVPGFLKEVRRIMLADDGGPAVTLNLSEDGGKADEGLTATQVVERLIDALPEKDDKIVLSEQALASEAGDKPAESGNEGESVSDRTAKAQEFLGLK